MARLLLPRLALLVSSLVLVRCAGSSSNVADAETADSGTTNVHPDADTSEPDAGTTTEPDGGSTTSPDADVVDSGTSVTPDSGTTGPDAGTSTMGNNALGTITNAQSTRCSGSLAGTCNTLSIRCDGLTDSTATVKISTPTGTSRGTVLFATGGPGTGLYESFASGGPTILNMVRGAGFTTVQIAFGGSFGWMTPPGGPRKQSCRYATVAKWVYDNVHAASETLPFCATGSSGGGTVISYALAHYGLESIFDFVLPTSAPVMARVDWACNCTNGSLQTPCQSSPQPYCYTGNSQFLDASYGSQICSEAVSSHTHQYDQMFLDDSVNAPDALLEYPHTKVRILLGSNDVASPVSSATYWYNSITADKSVGCVPGTGHTIPDTNAGAMAVASDVIANCAVQ